MLSGRSYDAQEAGCVDDVLQLVFRSLQGDEIILAFNSAATVESAKEAYSNVVSLRARHHFALTAEGLQSLRLWRPSLPRWMHA